MTTHPTSVNAGSVDGVQTVSAADLVPEIRSHISERRVALTVNEPAALITAQRHHLKVEKPDEALSISTIAC
jgi:hypothetical protein